MYTLLPPGAATFREHTDPLRQGRDIHQHCSHSCLGLTLHFEPLTWGLGDALSFHGMKAGDNLEGNGHES